MKIEIFEIHPNHQHRTGVSMCATTAGKSVPNSLNTVNVTISTVSDSLQFYICMYVGNKLDLASHRLVTQRRAIAWCNR